MSKSPLIISYASKGREDYPKGLKRLKESLDLNWPYEYRLHIKGQDFPEPFIRTDKLPEVKAFEVKEHDEVPYFFKYCLIQYYREQGYEKIYWLDSPMYLDKDISEIGPVMAFHNLGHPLYNYIGDRTAAYFGLSNDDLMGMPQTWGGAIGFDFSVGWVRELWDELISAAQSGCFADDTSTRPTFVCHKHDQAVLSVLFDKYDVPLYNYGVIVTHPHWQTGEWGNDFLISHRAIEP